MFFDEFAGVIKIIISAFWQCDKVREVVSNHAAYLISFALVGVIMELLKQRGIWLGRPWGKVVYAIVSYVVGNLLTKLLIFVPAGDIAAWWIHFIANIFHP